MPPADPPPLTEEVSRLRAWVRDFGGLNRPFADDLHVVLDALAAARAKAARHQDLLNRMQAALRIQIADMTDGDPVEYCTRRMVALDRLADDNARLRQALARIARPGPHDADADLDPAAVARAALGETGGTAPSRGGAVG